MSQFVEWDALLKVVVAGVLVGAGLPALFALGLRLLTPIAPVTVRAADSMSSGSGGGAVAAVVVRPTLVRRIGAYACFVVVVAAIAVGIGFVVAGGH